MVSIPYRDAELKARQQDDVWTVRLANLEVRARYLDLALAELLGSAPEAHRAAARLLSELAEVVEHQDTATTERVAVSLRPRRPERRRNLWARPLALGLRVVVLTLVACAAFAVTTWLTAFR